MFPMDSIVFLRPRLHAWLAAAACVTALISLPSAYAEGVTPRTPAPRTQAMPLADALKTLPRVTISADDQRHQPNAFPCAGFYPEHAAYRIELRDEQTLRIGASAHNSTDMTLAIQHEDGTWLCNDDTDESTRDPEVFDTLPAGTHTLYFGAFHALQPLDYTPYIRRDEKPQWARCIDVDVVTDPDENTTVLAGTIPDKVYKCHWMLGDEVCDWFVPPKANACVDLTEPAALRIRTQNASFDTTLVVQRVIDSDQGPVADNFTLRNDDISPDDRHSEIQADLEPGRYLVFVGSYHRPKEGSTFELQLGPVPLEAP